MYKFRDMYKYRTHPVGATLVVAQLTKQPQRPQGTQSVNFKLQIRSTSKGLNVQNPKVESSHTAGQFSGSLDSTSLKLPPSLKLRCGKRDDIFPDSPCPDSMDCVCTILLRAKKIKFFISFYCQQLSIFATEKIRHFRMKHASSCKVWGGQLLIIDY